MRILKTALNTKVLLFLIFIFAFFLRIWNIEKWKNEPWSHDEVNSLIWGRGILTNQFIYSTIYNVGHPYPLLLTIPNLLTTEIEKALLLSRILAFFFGMVTIWIFFLFCKNYFDLKTATAAVFLITIFPPHVLISKMGIQTSLSLFIGTLALYFLSKFIRFGDEKFFIYFVCAVGTGMLIHLSFILFSLSLFPFLFLCRSQLNAKLLFISFSIFILIIIPRIGDFFTIQHMDKSHLINVKDNLVGGLFLLFPGFLGGDLSANYIHKTSVPISLLFLLLGFNFISLYRERDKKNLSMLLSFLIGILLVSTITIPTHEFHRLTFYILIPVICAMSAKFISFLYERWGILIIFTIILLSLIDLLVPLVKEISQTTITFCQLCEDEILQKIQESGLQLVFIDRFSPPRNCLWYKLSIFSDEYFKTFRSLCHQNERFIENSLVIFVSARSSHLNVDINCRKIFFYQIKSRNFYLFPLGNMSCSTGKYPPITYNFYSLKKSNFAEERIPSLKI